MKAIETLEAELWLAQRAQRRNPSEENQAKVEAVEAEIAALNPSISAESAEAGQGKKDPAGNGKTAETQVETKVVALNPSIPAESAEAGQGEKSTAGNAKVADALVETKQTDQAQAKVEEPGTLAKVADASDGKVPDDVAATPKKETKVKAPAKKKEEPTK